MQREIKFALALGVAGIWVSSRLLGCAALTPQDRSDIAEYDAEQTACIAAHHGDKPAIDRCRADVKDRWNKSWDQRIDGGIRK